MEENTMAERRRSEQPEERPAAAGAEGEAGAEAAPAPSPKISPVDRSLLSGEGPELTRQQLAELRRKLRSKFH
jgi:hypothetical protein